jgi:hypothetical protein
MMLSEQFLEFLSVFKEASRSFIFFILFHNAHCSKNRIYVFPEKKLRSLNPNSYIHVSVSDLYNPRIGPHIWLQQHRQICILISHRYMNVEIGRQNIKLYVGNNETAQFLFWEYINGNQTFT